MSHRWVLDTYAIISADAMNKVCDVVQTSPWHISHDNVNLPMCVFSQRLVLQCLDQRKSGIYPKLIVREAHVSRNRIRIKLSL